MSDRVSQTILLCEDRPQASLVRAYMDRCDLNTKEPFLLPIIASERISGGGVAWVLRELPRQLDACRKRKLRANSLLVVVADADDFSVDERYRQLNNALRADRSKELDDSDPVVVLIPKRHIETWIRFGIGQPTNETDDYKFEGLGRTETREAAKSIYGWAHNNPKPNEGVIPSLRAALPGWSKIG
jgi:hypothetical protein